MPENLEKKIRKNLLLTFAYYGAEEAPLTLAQVTRYLFSREKFEDLSFFDFRNELNFLKSKNFIRETKGLFFLNKPEKKFSWKTFLKKEKESQIKINEVRKALKVFSFIPFLKNIFICGSVARKTSSEKSDIDFLIIAGKGRVWLVRFCLTIFSFLLGKKTSSFGERKDKFCLNHYRAAGNETIEKELQDIYSASEYTRMLNLYASENQNDFLGGNKEWMKNFEPNFDSIKPPLFHFPNSKKTKKTLERILGKGGGKALENLLKKIQKMKIKINLERNGFSRGARLVLKNNVIMFHLSPKSPVVMKKVRTNLEDMRVIS